LSRYNTRRALHHRTRRAGGPSPSRDEDDDGHATRAVLTEVSALTFTGRPEQSIARADAALTDSVGHDLTPAQRAELLGLRMDGLEATHRIVKRWPDDKRPCIVAMTANAMQGDREQCPAAEVDDYLSKPIRIDALTKALMRVRPRSVA
jgi:CheY-like chemotaxis protein